MAFDCRFNFSDVYGRKTSRTWHSSEALIATVITEIATLAPLLDAVTELGLDGVHISQVDEASNFAAESFSNIDTNMSVSVLGDDGYNYDFDIPAPTSGLMTADGSLDTSDADFVAFIAEFFSAGAWQINLRNPTSIANVNGGQLDK